MATNPMQKKSRISFILGMLVMLIIASLVVAFLYMQMQNQKKELDSYKNTSSMVYVLKNDVKSGQALTSGMFEMRNVTKTAIPSNATTNIDTTLNSYSLTTKDGMAIYYNPGTLGNSENPSYYYVGTVNDKKPIYKTDETGKEDYATSLQVSEKAYYYSDANKTQRVNIEISENAVVAKVDMNMNTVITSSLINRSKEIISNDLRKEEYNVISLPVDLAPEEYVDIRLRMPDGQDYIVVSKKKVSIPVVNGQYLPDTIQMNLTEEEIVLLSSAIVENFWIKGSELRANRYAEAGTQSAATMTYYPSNEVQKLIESDSNIVRKAINGILEKRQEIRNGINSAMSKYKEDEIDDYSQKVDTSITSSEEARKNYLQSLQVVQ